MSFLNEIRRTIRKINNLEANKKVVNSEIIEIELKSQRDILNEQSK